MVLLGGGRGCPQEARRRNRSWRSVDSSLSKELASSREQHRQQTLIHALGQEPPQSSANRRSRKTTGQLFQLQYLTNTPTMLPYLPWPLFRP